MIGVDTNILVRYLIRDDEDQYEQARAAMAALTPEQPGFVSLVSLLETVWLLRRTYKIPRHEVLSTVAALAAADAIRLQEQEAVEAAVALARRESCDLPDALVAVFGAACDYTLTFDKAAARLPGMRQPGVPSAGEAGR